VGLKVGTTRIAHLAHRMGITTPISTNPAMTIGGLSVGVTPLDMAHSYETIAHGGQRVSGSLVSDFEPVGIQEVSAGGHTLSDGHHNDRNAVITKRVLPPGVANTETSVLETVLQYGTAKAAAIGQFAAGKTGTTSNYGDAWFVGWDSKYTVAVWVGYPNSLVPMTTDFGGTPVLGGTFPALIWHNFMLSAIQVEHDRAEQGSKTKGAKEGTTGSRVESPSSSETTGTPSPTTGKHASGAGEAQSGAPTHEKGASESGGGAPGVEHTPAAPSPTPATPQPAVPAPATPSTEAAPTSKSGAGAGATGGVSPTG
jgi:penicillin-binding protein 1A